MVEVEKGFSIFILNFEIIFNLEKLLFDIGKLFKNIKCWVIVFL